MSEGHLGELAAESKPAIQVVDPEPADSPIVPSSERCEGVEDDLFESNARRVNYTNTDSVGEITESAVALKQQESSAASDQIDTQEINVVVPMEERSSRYTNR